MIKPSLQEVELPPVYFDIRSCVYKGADGTGSTHLTRDEIWGFEDVIDEGFGNGFYYNTSTSITQLIVALSVSPNPDIKVSVTEHIDAGSRSLVNALRAKKVLNGCKILDLGCGMLPGFAVAAKTLGAEVHAVDGEDISAEFKDMLDSHSVLDISAPTAAETIADATGGEFDLVTANIIDNVPGHPKWEVPSFLDLQPLSEQLLKSGGHYYFGNRSLLQKAI